MTQPSTQAMPAPVVGVLVTLAAIGVLAALNGAGYLFLAADAGGETRDLYYGYAFLSFVATLFSTVGVVMSLRRSVIGQTLAVFVGCLVAFAGLYLAMSTNLAVRLLGYDTFGYLLIVAGSGLVALAVVPASSRAWFR